MMQLKDKYHSRHKAEEYAMVSWSEFGHNNISETFYAQISDLIRNSLSQIVNPMPNVVEIGFGAGRLIYETKMACPDAYVYGVENSSSMIDISRALLIYGDVEYICGKFIGGKALTNIFLMQGDIEAIGLQSAVADLLVSVNVLDRVANTRQAVKELARIVKIGGRLIIATAFDYEGYTPVSERLGLVQLETEFLVHGVSCLGVLELEFQKHLVDGSINKYGEWVLMMQREGIVS
ncbi:MAG: methyltransferase domain-containing protein [Caldilineaceae bacterium]|nr:methyltransferase domain-containing protein [Caldilineaceae bacterium]